MCFRFRPCLECFTSIAFKIYGASNDTAIKVYEQFGGKDFLAIFAVLKK